MPCLSDCVHLDELQSVFSQNNSRIIKAQSSLMQFIHKMSPISDKYLRQRILTTAMTVAFRYLLISRSENVRGELLAQLDFTFKPGRATVCAFRSPFSPDNDRLPSLAWSIKTSDWLAIKNKDVQKVIERHFLVIGIIQKTIPMLPQKCIWMTKQGFDISAIKFTTLQASVNYQLLLTQLTIKGNVEHILLSCSLFMTIFNDLETSIHLRQNLPQVDPFCWPLNKMNIGNRAWMSRLIVLPIHSDQCSLLTLKQPIIVRWFNLELHHVHWS